MNAVIQDRPRRATDVVVIGAGHCGLAVSYFLARHSIDHVVLERGEIANSWRTERWDSLKLLTPNWQSRLPGFRYRGEDPDGFMSMEEVTGFIEEYARRNDAPVHTATEVTSVERSAGGYRVCTHRGEWACRGVVLASGAFNVPAIPDVARQVPETVEQISTRDYRRPEQLRKGGVLVVGASATGLQLAREIRHSGRPVTLAVGEHVRLPRRYRGKDIQYWMDTAGVLDEAQADIEEMTRARRVPSPQLVGSNELQILDLNAMSRQGVRLVGKLMGVQNGVAQFSGSLRNVCSLADLKMNRLLKRIDEWVDRSGQAGAFGPAERFEPTRVDEVPCLGLNLEAGGIGTVLWATGYRPDYSWLTVPVLDRKGMVRHQGGVADAPGLYLMGLPFMRTRKSSYIHGVEDDARSITDHLANFLEKQGTEN